MSFDVSTWGTVAQWVGSLLTSVSLLLAFSILRRDRALAKRKSADEMVAWQSQWRFQGDQEVDVVAYYTGAAPLPSATLHIMDPFMHTTLYLHDEKLNYLRPEFNVRHMTTLDHRSGGARVYIVIGDAKSRVWVRNVKTNRYVNRLIFNIRMYRLDKRLPLFRYEDGLRGNTRYAENGK